MSSELSPYAIHRIIHFLENEDSFNMHLRLVNDKWNYVYVNYFLGTYYRSIRPPPMEHLRSLELALFLKKDLDNADTRSVFGHGRPLVFDRHLPRLLVPTLIEAFQELKEAPSFLDVTLNPPSGPPRDISERWPQAYVNHLPCGSCTEVVGLGKPNTERFIVEKFHIPSKRFEQELLVELHFALQDRRRPPWFAVPVRPSSAPDVEKNALRKVVIRLHQHSCGGSPSAVAFKSESLLLLPEFASEVYGFLDRVYVGASLIANRGMNEVLYKLRLQLPVHHLMCEFKEETVNEERRVQSWMILHHFRRDSYSDLRRFKIPSTAGPSADRSLVRGYLSNSHLFHFKPSSCFEVVRPQDARFALKMLAATADRNVSLDALRIWAGVELREGELSDYRSMDAVFGGGMRLASLELSLFENKFASLGHPWHESDEPRRWDVIPSSLWIAGIYLLRNSERFEVDYDSNRLMRPICLKLVQLCEKFERGEVSEHVQRFKLATSRYMALPFNDDNKAASGVKVGDYEWDVYRFRNATTRNWLTACVGHERSENSHRSVVHIVKGEVLPDASFAAE